MQLIEELPHRPLSTINYDWQHPPLVKRIAQCQCLTMLQSDHIEPHQISQTPLLMILKTVMQASTSL